VNNTTSGYTLSWARQNKKLSYGLTEVMIYRGCRASLSLTIETTKMTYIVDAL